MNVGMLRWALLAAVLAVGCSRPAAALSITPPFAISVTNMCVTHLHATPRIVTGRVCLKAFQSCFKYCFSVFAGCPSRQDVEFHSQRACNLDSGHREGGCRDGACCALPIAHRGGRPVMGPPCRFLLVIDVSWAAPGYEQRLQR